MECITGKPDEVSSRSLPEPAGQTMPKWVQAQTTYATLLPVEGGWQVRVVLQTIWCGGTCYELHEIYGIENCATGNPDEDITAGKVGWNSRKRRTQRTVASPAQAAEQMLHQR